MNLISDIMNEKIQPASVDGVVSKTFVVKGALGEVFTKALNVAYAKKNPVTGESNYGETNPDAKQQGSLAQPAVESQQMEESLWSDLVDHLETSLGTNRDSFNENPVTVFVLSDDEEGNIIMNEDDLDAEINSRRLPDGLILVYDVANKPNEGVNTRVVDSMENHLISLHRSRGGKVYSTPQAFIRDQLR